MLFLARLLSNWLRLFYLPHSLGKGLHRNRCQVEDRARPDVKSASAERFLRCRYVLSERLVMVHCSCTYAQPVQHPGYLLPGKIGFPHQHISDDAGMSRTPARCPFSAYHSDELYVLVGEHACNLASFLSDVPRSPG